MERPAWSVEDYLAPGFTFITYMDRSDMTGDVTVYARIKDKSVRDTYGVAADIIGVERDAFTKLVNGDIKSAKEYEEVWDYIESHARFTCDFNYNLIELMSGDITNMGEAPGAMLVAVVIVCVIIIFTSVFCIKNSFDISITEKIREYGMLRSVGATKKQIRKNVMYEASLLGIIGIPLGIALGELASVILVKVSNYLLRGSIMAFEDYDFLIFTPSWIAILVSIVLGALTIYLSAFRSARRASKVSPIVSIRNSADIKIKAKKLRTPRLIKKMFGIGGEMSYKNLKRNRKKYRTTIISIMVSVLTFVALSSFMKMAFNIVDLEIDSYDYDLSMSISIFKTDETDEVYNKALGTLGLENVKTGALYIKDSYNMEGVQFSDRYKEIAGLAEDYEMDTYSSYIGIAVPDDATYRAYIKELGLSYEDIWDKAIVADTVKISALDEDGNEKKYKVREYDIDVGDVVTGYTNDDEDTEAIRIKIGKVADKVPFGLNEYSSYIILSKEFYDSMEHPEEYAYLDSYYLSDDPDALQDALEEDIKNDGSENYAYDIYNIAELAREMRNLFLLVAIFLYGFIIVISLIGITNIFNTMTTNMSLRRKEFAMLKSVGMTTKEFNRMIRLETVFMGTKSLLYGLPVGIALSYVIYLKLGKEEGFPFAFPYAAIVISVIAVFVLIAGIMKYSMSKINKQNTIETIRNENI